MSFRDDHDAAITRIAALERDLAAVRARAQEKSQHDAQRIAMLEREIDGLRRHEPPAPRRARPPSTPPVPTSPRDEPIDELATRGPPVSLARVVVFVLVVKALAILAIVLAGRV